VTRSLRLFVLGGWCLGAGAQFGVQPAPDVLLVGRYNTKLAYEEVLARLDGYYQEQVGRKLAVVFPKIAPGSHYETWHDVWFAFSPSERGLDVTMRRATDPATLLLAKGWMLQIAGRTRSDVPVRFEELPPLARVQDRYLGSRRDLARALEDQGNFHMIDTWQHAGLLVSDSPLARITLEPDGHGIHHYTVSALSAAVAQKLSARIANSMSGSCICAVYSEAVELDRDLRKEAVEKSGDVSTLTAQTAYLFQLDPSVLEAKLRADPESKKRIAAAEGWFALRYRVDRPYAKVELRWAELTGYSRDTGRFDSERAMTATTAQNVRMPPGRGVLLGRRIQLGALAPGAYRLVLDGQTASGEKKRIDQRDFWFDGKTFEEL